MIANVVNNDREKCGLLTIQKGSINSRFVINEITWLMSLLQNQVHSIEKTPKHGCQAWLTLNRPIKPSNPLSHR